jgi:kynurenine formamidase
VDLSLPLVPGAAHFPGDPPVEVDGPYNALEGPVREYCYRLHLPTQAGTHIQGPHYFLAGGRPIDAFPLERFEGPAYVVDVRGLALFTPQSLAPLAGLDLAGAIVLFHSGYMARLMAAATPGELERLVATKPGLSLDAAIELAGRGVSLLGIDSVGLEPGGDPSYPVNRYLCQREVLILEGLTNLDQLPPAGAWVEAFPLPVPGVEGTPCRAVARVP